MSDVGKQPYRADGGDISTGRLKEIADNPYGDEEKCWLAKRVLASLEAEPVSQVLSSRAGNDTSTIDKALPEGTTLYTVPPAPVVPNGWVMVPVAPTEEMLAELCLVKGWTDRALNARYQAMLAAAPKPEA
ncbi:TPA: hypothetical protein H4H74_000721 [Escherichia coli]|uniref:hypothetical protein n=1 Tax=Enterobacteriaceae TaxID=543 RepID=UPI00076F2234|nr:MULTISPECIES: hypothetical protein [Enterobacteriaceae]HCR2102704.1 hypothetical protein [Enterobacter asburiae]EEZ5380715.1 hypothetical protein [Escherichia coli]EFE0693426.1 hypothetical protein [Escherichia coli]EFN5612685.1 hypothetical protein [Escherichia coli]EHK6340383.1 hypothetical protein [Escherichia coli]